jgi:hypothetical protein
MHWRRASFSLPAGNLTSATLRFYKTRQLSYCRPSSSPTCCSQHSVLASYVTLELTLSPTLRRPSLLSPEVHQCQNCESKLHSDHYATQVSMPHLREAFVEIYNPTSAPEVSLRRETIRLRHLHQDFCEAMGSPSTPENPWLTSEVCVQK